MRPIDADSFEQDLKENDGIGDQKMEGDTE